MGAAPTGAELIRPLGGFTLTGAVRPAKPVEEPFLHAYAKAYAQLLHTPDLEQLCDAEMLALFRHHMPLPVGKSAGRLMPYPQTDTKACVSRFFVNYRATSYRCVAVNSPAIDHLVIMVLGQDRHCVPVKMPEDKAFHIYEYDAANEFKTCRRQDLYYEDPGALHAGLFGLYLPRLTLDLVGLGRQAGEVAFGLAQETLTTDVPYMRLHPGPRFYGDINAIGVGSQEATYYTYRWPSFPNSLQMLGQYVATKALHDVAGSLFAKRLIGPLIEKLISGLLPPVDS